MADNIIKRIIKLILDKDSAKKTQDDANSVAKGIEKGWKSMAEKVAEYLGAAFIVDKIIHFGKEAVKAASDSQTAWAQLKGSVDSTGVSFDAMEGRLHAAADAFQDATVHGSEDYAKSLDRMITLTHDTSASVNNMGLVANVAAKFFKGDLEPATDLVAKAMNGNVMELQRMGIHAKNAQDALDILANRSMGAAAREAASFDGQLQQLDNSWSDVLRDLGTAIISSGGATDALTVLRAAIQTLGEWVNNNRDEIATWVTKGVKFAIDAADVFIRAIVGMGDQLAGGFLVSLGLAAKGLAFLIRGMQGVVNVSAMVKSATGDIHGMFGDLAQAESLKKTADAIDDWGSSVANLGSDKVKNGLKVLATPFFSSEQFTNAPKIPPKPIDTTKPQTAAGALSPQIKAAIDEYEKAGQTIKIMTDLMGDSFDNITPDIDRTIKLLVTLKQVGIDPASVGFGDLADRLKMLSPFDKDLKTLAKTIREDLAFSAIQSTSAIGETQAAVNRLTADQTALSAAIRAGVDQRKQDTDAFKDLVVQYNAIAAALKQAEFALTIDEAAKALSENLTLAIIENAAAVDKLKIKQASLREQIVAGIKDKQQDSKEFKQLVKDYDATTDAIKRQTIAMQYQTAAADFLADALGTAMQGGLHEAAVQKAKQNAIEAAEMLVRAGAFALFGDFPDAGKAAVLAGQFAGIAAAWGVLAASTHGGGAPISSVTPTSSGTSSAGSDLGSARSSSSSASSQSQQPSTEVSIYLVGPGFDMLNPEVQRVVYGAYTEAKERYGDNTKVRVRSAGGGR